MKEEYLNAQMETMDQGELRKLQEKKFLKQLDYVWARSPFYQEKFKAHLKVIFQQGNVTIYEAP